MKNALLILLSIAVVVLVFLQQCSPSNTSPIPVQFALPSYELPQPDTVTITTTDTLYPPARVVMVEAPIPPPEVIYLKPTGERIQDSTQLHESDRVVKLYVDSVDTDELTIYYAATVEGELVAHDLAYQLKVPRKIVKTQVTTITEPVGIPTTQLHATCRVGTNWNGQSSIAPGLLFVGRRGWSLGYSYDLITQQHAVQVGVRLFQLQ